MDLEDIHIKDFTDDGQCSNCGQCCSNTLPLSRKEVKKIKAYIKKKHIKEQRHNVIAGVDMTCPFRDEKSRKCLVYEVRPQICREFKCNHTLEDIKRAKINLHKQREVVFMRNEFFKNGEDISLIKKILDTVTEAENKKERII